MIIPLLGFITFTVMLLLGLLLSRSIIIFLTVFILYTSVTYKHALSSEWIVYSACLTALYISIRCLYKLFHYDSEINKTDIDLLKSQQIALCSNIDTLEIDGHSLEQGYNNSLQLFDIMKSINKEMDFNSIFTIFSNRIIEKYHCSQCMLFMLSKEYRKCTEKYIIPDNTNSVSGIYTAVLENSPSAVAEPYKIYNFYHKALFCYFPVVAEKMPVLVIADIAPDTVDELQSVIIPLFMELNKSMLYEKIITESITDGLTGLYQRRYCMVSLEEELERAKSKNLAGSILMLDIDDFKTYNDKYGHLVGDFILRQMADIVLSIRRSTDFAGRIGGEEFIIFLHDTDKKGAIAFAERLRKSIEKHIFTIHGLNLRITVSIGIADTHETNYELDAFLARADVNLYKAKEQGKNKVCC